MPNIPTDDDPARRFERLRSWLFELVELLLAQGGAVATALVRTAAGRSAVVQIDDVALKLEGQAVPHGLAIAIEPATEDEPRNFACSAETLREIIDGRRLLDAQVAEGRIEVRAPLADLLAMHELVLRALAAGPLSRPLRELWAQFDSWWPQRPAPCSPLSAQLPKHGRLRAAVPIDVLTVRLDAAPE
jgi:hypothetical protein